MDNGIIEREIAIATKMQKWVSKSNQCFPPALSIICSAQPYESPERERAAAYWVKIPPPTRISPPPHSLTYSHSQTASAH